MHDPADPDPGRRFKAVSIGPALRLWASYSADGLRWTPSPNNPVGGGLELLGAPVKFNGCYYVNGQGDSTAQNKPIPHRIVGASKRDMITYASCDFEHWTYAAALGFRRDNVPLRSPSDFEAHRGEQIHEGASLWNRGNVLLGFYGQYHNTTNDRRFATCDIGLVVSNDALHFREPVPDFKLVPCDEEPETDPTLGVRLMQGQAFENVGDRTIHWYNVWEYPSRGQIRIATWQRDRLGYVAPVPAQMFRGPGLLALDIDPHLISCPVHVTRPGVRVFVNADRLSERCAVTVELLDLAFRPLARYSGDASLPINVAGLRTPVAWRENQSLDRLDQPVRVRVRWSGLQREDGRLYAIYVG